MDELKDTSLIYAMISKTFFKPYQKLQNLLLSGDTKMKECDGLLAITL